MNILVSLEVLGDWIRREFLAALPPRWQVRFSAKHWEIIDDFRNLDRHSLDDKRPIAYSVPSDEVLLRRIELPLVSSFRLFGLMKFEAPRHIPMSIDRAVFDFRVVSRHVASSRMTVDLAVLRSETLRAILQQSKRSDVGLDAICLSTDQEVWISRRLVERIWRKRWTRRRHGILLIRILTPFLIILAWIFAAENWASRLAQSRDAAVILARKEAIGIEPLRNKLLALNDQVSFLASTRQRPSVAAIAEEVARLLPDDAWLDDLNIQNNSVQIHGTARNAAELLRIFSSSPLFSSVQFEAPLTQAESSSGEQFDITMTRK